MQPEFTPTEIAISDLDEIYPHRQRSVFKAGSSDALADGSSLDVLI
ncbi:MAG: hypothetical protein QW258_01855 [Thermoplasmata archaeon]